MPQTSYDGQLGNAVLNISLSVTCTPEGFESPDCTVGSTGLNIHVVVWPVVLFILITGMICVVLVSWYRKREKMKYPMDSSESHDYAALVSIQIKLVSVHSPPLPLIS